MDDPAAGHDEAAWLGYTAFDPRPAAAEVAQIRSSLGDLFKAHDEPASTFLIVSQSRPIGSFFTSARAASVLLQVGPAEPWSAPVRLSIAQQLARRWVGGALRIAAEHGHEAESWWFSEGVARFVAMHVLSHLGLAAPADVRDEIAGLLAVVAMSGYGRVPPRDGTGTCATRARGTGRRGALPRRAGRGDIVCACSALKRHRLQTSGHGGQG